MLFITFSLFQFLEGLSVVIFSRFSTSVPFLLSFLIFDEQNPNAEKARIIIHTRFFPTPIIPPYLVTNPFKAVIISATYNDSKYNFLKFGIKIKDFWKIWIFFSLGGPLGAFWKFWPGFYLEYIGNVGHVQWKQLKGAGY